MSLAITVEKGKRGGYIANLKARESDKGGGILDDTIEDVISNGGSHNKGHLQEVFVGIASQY